ncbi:RNA-directed DNA polymerase from mobile element jockey [Acropora cervicornis]|uniref:RNA-directed DNA polymerase from mobile element jockey n=1 Tax=Acropora cervicornis TaxID=6130 RepID=A0AAD9QNL0_ACRCE|nr:RNA-directed DNA polymerase from mobile element jockey [Acropora cervicornis]
MGVHLFSAGSSPGSANVDLKRVADDANLDDRHFGYLKGSSTTAALVDLMNFLYTNTDNPKQAVQLCYYDLTKRFDRVDHNIVIDILQQLDVHPSILICIHSFHTARQQRVHINGHMSSWKCVPAGIPQGSVLGPTLSLVMVNSLAHQDSW